MIRQFILACSILAVVMLANFSCSKHQDFKIRDYFIDSSESGKFVFMFVETELKDSSRILDFGQKIQHDDTYAKTESDTSLCVFRIMFFNPVNAVKVGEKDLRNIFTRMDSVSIAILAQKTRFVDNAFTYIGFNGSGDGVSLPRSSLTVSSVFVPEQGVKASEILKLMKK